MGNQFVHMQLATDNVDVAKKFYKKVFDWKVNELGADMGSTTVIDTGSKVVGGGIEKKAIPGQPTSWLVYAEVDSVKKTMAKAGKAGATIVIPFQELGGRGAIGIFVDPTGAGFGVWERPKKATAKAPAKTSKTSKKK